MAKTQGTPWRMPLAVMGRPTGDKRMFDPHSLSHLALPLPFRHVSEDVGGHSQAHVVGRIEDIDYAEGDGQPIGTGVFFTGDDAPEETRRRAEEALFMARQGVAGPSVDLDSSESEGRLHRPQRTVGQAAQEMACGCGGDHAPSPVQAVTKGRIRAATLVPIAAFAELAGHGTYGADVQTSTGPGPDPNVNANAAETEQFSIAEFVAMFERADATDPVYDDQYATDPDVGGGVDRSKLDASDFIDPAGRRFPIVTPQDVHDAVSSYGRAKPLIPLDAFRRRLTEIAHRKGEAFVAALPDSWDALTASAAAGSALDAPPDEWFQDPQLDGPTPLTIADDGRVFGHLAAWGTCHTGIGEACVTPPKTRTGYAYFHTGELVTASGRRIPVGRLTYGGGHARHHLGYAAAAEHYDATSAVGAYVRAGEDEHGIWVAGAMAPTATSSAYATMRGAPLSGDWRRVAGNLELVAALHVNTAGFPIPRAMAAAGVPQTLIAAGAVYRTGGLYHDTPANQQLIRDAVREELAALRRAEDEQAALAAAAAELQLEITETDREAYTRAQQELAAELAAVGEE